MLLQLDKHALAISGDGATITQWQMGQDHLFFPQQNTYNEAGELKRRGGMHIGAPVFGSPPLAQKVGLPQHGTVWRTAPKARKLDDQTGLWLFPPTRLSSNYPFKWDMEIRMHLQADQFTHRITVQRHPVSRATDRERMPCNFGLHPYFPAPGAFEIDGRVQSFGDLPRSVQMQLPDFSVIRVRIPAGTVTMELHGYRWLNLWSDCGSKYFCVEPLWDHPYEWGTERGAALEESDDCLNLAATFRFEPR